MKSDRKIIIYCNDSNYVIGGVELFNKNLEDAFDEKGVSYKSIYKINCLKKFNILREPFSILYLIFVTRFIKTKFILIHHSNFYSILILPFIYPFFKEIRLISHVGDEWMHIKNKFLRCLTIVLLKKCVNKTFVISDNQIRFFKGVDTHKVTSIIPKKFAKLPATKTSKENYILFLARVCVEKGILDLLKIYEKNHKFLPKLKICGPIDSQSLRKKILKSENNCKGKIEIVEPVYQIEKKIKLIDESIFGIYPSYYDAFPLTPIEFFCRGKLCITSNISESINFIKDKKLLIEPGNFNHIKSSIEYCLGLIKNKKSNSEINETIKLAREIAEGKIVKYLL